MISMMMMMIVAGIRVRAEAHEVGHGPQPDGGTVMGIVRLGYVRL